jgi:hypothetical protein
MQKEEEEVQEQLLYGMYKNKFVAKVTILLDKHHDAKGIEGRIKTAYDLFRFMNRKLPYLLENNVSAEFDKFATVIRNKVCEFNQSHASANGWPDINQTLVKGFLAECAKADAIINKHYPKINYSDYCERCGAHWMYCKCK